jgi:hypothetical protein
VGSCPDDRGWRRLLGGRRCGRAGIGVVGRFGRHRTLERRSWRVVRPCHTRLERRGGAIDGDAILGGTVDLASVTSGPRTEPVGSSGGSLGLGDGLLCLGGGFLGCGLIQGNRPVGPVRSRRRGAIGPGEHQGQHEDGTGGDHEQGAHHELAAGEKPHQPTGRGQRAHADGRAG